MAYLGSWKIDDYITFCCNTHDPDTGVATDADAVPAYRVYEDETGAAITNGVMAKLDDANTTGFYSERLQLLAATGFEKGKHYTIYISATVDSDTGTMHHNLQIEAEVDVNTASGLHADLVDGGRLDLLIDAIKAVTDALPNAGALNDLATILTDTNELQTDDVPGLIAALNDPTAAAIADAVWDELSTGHVDAGKAGAQLWTDIDAVLADTNELQTDDVPGLIAALNDVSTAEVNAQVDTALSDIHLDHLLATDYDPASKPGVATALLNELVENDVGVSRFTANALEEAPTGGSAPTVTEIRQEMDNNSTQLAAIVADTNELQTDDVPGLISGLNDPTAAAIADAVWDELSTGHVDAGKAGQQLWTDVDAILADTDAILTDTNELQTDDVPGLIAGLNDPTAAVIADAVWDELSTGHVDAGKAGQQLWTDLDAVLADTGELQTDDVPGLIAGLNDPTAAAIRTEMDNNSTQLAAIVADTNELQLDDVPGLIAALNDPTAAAIADAVWNELSTGHVDAGKAGQQLWTDVDAILADTGADGVALSESVRQAVADEILKRGISNVEDAADATSLAALVLAAFESAIVASTWTIRKTGGTTFATRTVTTDAAADPITGVT